MAIPRSYAVIIGISKYEDPKVQPLEFSDRDAESIDSILISPEGGKFSRAENVHKLIGAQGDARQYQARALKNGCPPSRKTTTGCSCISRDMDSSPAEKRIWRRTT